MSAVAYVENMIVKKCLIDLYAAGFYLSVNDGEETTISRSRDLDALFKAMMTTDEDYILVDKISETGAMMNFGWVRFIYGNSGWDVINDYTTNLDEYLTGTMALCKEIDEAGG